jgi:O-phospho-L-seryl-tRNASec:L-selenocysteinyl-tRNA synthase
MEESSLTRLIPRTYALQGLQNIRNRDNLFNQLLGQQKLLEDGLDDQTIEYFLGQLSLMDSNNFRDKAGVGEREGRVFSGLVAQRHFGFSHGIGRSGDIAEVQPKAAGSSILYKLTNKLVSHALQVAGLKTELHSIVFPLATGMTISSALLAMKSIEPRRSKVIWCRIDQKSCLKAISLAGLTPVVVEPVRENNMLVTNIQRIREILLSEEREHILAVVTTTSCFAPRQPDRIDEVAVLCQEFAVFHLVNNAYGLQCPKICKLIDRAHTKGRVDAGMFADSTLIQFHIVSRSFCDL